MIKSLGGNGLKVVLAGGTGFIGQAITNELLKNGYKVIILSRNEQLISQNSNPAYIGWLNGSKKYLEIVKDADVVINLAGVSINSGRWTEQQKKRILSSRLEATEEVLSFINTVKPALLINASAIGYYGTSRTATFDEGCLKPGDDFLATTVRQWEDAASVASQYNVRTVLCRFGIVLGKYGGALPKMAFPYRLFLGGTIGTGDQWVSWIHISDVIKAIMYIIQNNSIEGPVNFTTEQPVKMKEFGQKIGRVLNRPHWFPVPKFVLEALLGEMSLLIVEGQKVVPKKLKENGFQFYYPTLDKALQNIYS